MDIRIGIAQAPRELELTVKDAERDSVRKQIDDAVGSGSGMVWLTDDSGREVAVPVERLAYVEFGRDTGGRSIGFSS